MSQEKPSDTHFQSVTNKGIYSLNGVARLRPQPPKASQINPNTASSTTTPSVTSEGNGSNGAGESSSSS